MPPSFAESFWSEDYGTGLQKLFTKLRQGCTENEELIQLVKRRAEAEEYHGVTLQRMAGDAYKRDGFQRDDGASVKRAFEGMVKETHESGKTHLKMATNLQTMVLNPFGKWAQEHAERVSRSEKELTGKVKVHDKQHNEVKKLRSTYFNKCRILEDFQEENKFAFPAVDGPGTPKSNASKAAEEDSGDDEEAVELGDTFFTAAQIKLLISRMLTEVSVKEAKLPILGTFQHVSTGLDVAQWLRHNLVSKEDQENELQAIKEAEQLGQGLVDNGFLRYLGVGNTFANSSVLNYQWRDKALVLAGRMKPGENSLVSRASTMPYVGEYVQTYVSNEHANETPLEKLTREATQANTSYKAAVKKLDGLRADLEASMMEHFRFMERCETDRLKALKDVMMDISAAISNVIPGMKSSMDNMVLFQESISPAGDLNYLIESYKTGQFVPRTVIYENYYNAVDDQTFGVDIELRARQDKKRVPNFIATLLSYMDESYPLLANDEQRQKLWIRNVPLHLIHALRAELNNGKPVDKQVLAKYDHPIVASCLRLYLLELPDSLISCTLYDTLKAIYAAHGTEEETENRVTALSNALQQLRISNIATLDALMTHLARLTQLTNADEEYKQALSTHFGIALHRPRQESALAAQDKHRHRLLLDLLAHKQDIFSQLKRATTSRPRSATDEKERRTRMEERNKAISASASSHGSSLAPPPSSHGPASPLPDTQPGHQTYGHESSQDAPFEPPDEGEDIVAGYEDASFDPSSFVLPSERLREGEAPVLEEARTGPSLSRRKASHRLSRHGRTDSRSLTDTMDSLTMQSESKPSSPTRHSIQLEDPGVGVSLEDREVYLD
ncbi:hypothetical protein BCR37DRAFT_401536 [Protomyces lactucae-debilis]|uniref:Rho-GTPase-activating protein 8 n=1 Tax=Protomyces lactucae-debilis TaxID=2754530 RepID=A0A1Y2FVE9_PROLT|nr:uncharacterized protein BCR37DRAFT_401536 [Protomyces lactucae-debilis]ORY87547.1 hypothetical protein BCR37DRAFT_401536 [Protomyces lactucae-debilis]